MAKKSADFKKSEHQFDMFEAMVELSPNLLVVIDLQGRLIYLNQSGYKMVHLATDFDLEKLTLSDCFSDPEEARRIWDKIDGARGGHWAGETHFKNFFSGETFPVQLTAFYLRDGKGSSSNKIAIIVRDLTESYRVKRELEEQRSLVENSARLSAIGELAEGVGHEINNPLAIVMGSLHKLKKEIEKDVTDKSALLSIVEKQNRAGSHIMKIVTGLRDLAYFSKTDDSMESSVRDCVTETMDLVGEVYKKDGISIEVNLPQEEMLVIANPSQLRQIFLNFISNAKDALTTEKSPKISISAKGNGKYWRVSIEDNGCGISSEIQKKMYIPFFTTKEVGDGTGLGLSLCQKYIQNCGGELSFETSEVGTKFYIDLIKIKSNDKAAFETGDAQEKQPIKALLVDDEVEIRELIHDYLVEGGCEVTSLGCPVEALNLAQNQSFDLILSDLHMPEMSGITLFTNLKDQSLNAKALKIIVTGGVVSDLDQVKDDFRLGVVEGVVYKPFTPEDIYAVVSKAAEKRKKVLKSS
tara:strand:+ start:188969 stop:190543 length:1575 start_codon:yes stop_codon:yes gene_type:complete